MSIKLNALCHKNNINFGVSTGYEQRALEAKTVTLVNFQLDSQNSYLFTYNTSIKILYMFRALPCSS